MRSLQFILAIILTTTIASAQVNLDEGWYYIKNAVSGKYLQVAGSLAKANTNVEIGTGNKSANQKWKLSKLSNGYIVLTSSLGDFSLDIANGENKKGTNVIIYHTYKGDAQQLKLISSSNGNAVFIGTKISQDSKVICVHNYKDCPIYEH